MFGNRKEKYKKVWVGFLIEKVPLSEAKEKRISLFEEVDRQINEELDQKNIDEEYVYLLFGRKVPNTREYKTVILIFLAVLYFPILFCLIDFFKY